MSNLKDKTAKGLGWGFADSIFGTGITAVVSIVLARLLSPAEFGLIGMTAIFISLSTTLVDSGFCDALTRKKFADTIDFNTVFYTNMAISVILYVILYFSAPFIADFYGIPVLVRVIRILSLSIIVIAFSQIQKVIFIRNIDFKKQAIISLIASLSSGVIGIVMALRGYGVWSLVAQQLSKLTISSILLWVMSSWKPSFVFSYIRFKEMFSFGGKLLVAAIINVVWNEIYSLIIGKVYNPSLVGQYSRADKFRNLVTSNVGTVVQRVSYPVLSKIQDEKERQVRVYRKVIKTTMLLTFTLVLGLLACAEAMIVTLIGEKWLPSVEFLRILCLSGLFIPLMMNSINVINANGKSNITLFLQIVKTLLAVIPVLLGIFISIKALLWGMVAVSLISYLIHACFVSKVITYPLSEQFSDILPFFISAGVMALLVWFTGLLTLPMWLLLLLQLFVGFVVTVFTYQFIFKCEEYFDIKKAVLNIFPHNFKK